jgi:hypothetical protein
MAMNQRSNVSSISLVAIMSRNNKYKKHFHFTKPTTFFIPEKPLFISQDITRQRTLQRESNGKKGKEGGKAWAATEESQQGQRGPKRGNADMGKGNRRREKPTRANEDRREKS